jgi:hypothetical protein
MRARVCLGAAVIAAALGGCAATAPAPAGLTSDEIAAYNDQALQTIWLNTGLAATMDRPTVAQGEPLSQSDWFDFVVTCMTDAGHAQVGVSWSLGEGAILETVSGAALDDEHAQLDFYLCAAQHPIALSTEHSLLSAAELDYIYDYYATQLVPCILLNGYRLDSVITRHDFGERQGQWNPYYAITQRLSLREFTDLRLECGPELPRLD